MKQKQFMREAIRLSIHNVSAGLGGPFAAVIVKDNTIIAEGVNRVTRDNDPTAHAEIVAIRKACQQLNTFQLADCDIYCSCEPCPMCLGAIYWARPARLFYANSQQDAADINFDDKFIYDELSLPSCSRHLPTQQILREEAHEAFKLWRATAKKIEY